MSLRICCLKCGAFCSVLEDHGGAVTWLRGDGSRAMIYENITDQILRLFIERSNGVPRVR